MAEVFDELLYVDIATQLWELREDAGLSQRELAAMAGTTQSVICRMEDGNYRGHSVSMISRIARALGMRIYVGFEPCTSEQEESVKPVSI